MSRSQKGLCMVILSGIVFGVMPSAVTFCYSQGVTASLVILFRYIFLSLVLLPSAIKSHDLWNNYRANWKKLLFLTLAGTATPLLLFTAYSSLPTGIATTIHFIYPVIVVLICTVVFHERLSKGKMLCFALCVGGILLMVETSSQKLSTVGMLAAFLSSVTWGCYIVFLNKIDLQNVTSGQIVFYVGIGSLVLITLYGILTGSFSAAVTGIGWAALIVSNLIIAVFGSMFFAIGTQYTDAQSSAIASTLEPITSIIVGVLFLNEHLSARSAAGAAMVLAAVTLLAVFSLKSAENVNTSV